MGHHCHANGCKTPTEPKMLFCLRHWRMTPKDIQDAVWAAFHPKQCVKGSGVSPTRRWLHAYARAVISVAEQEGKPCGMQRRTIERLERQGITS